MFSFSHLKSSTLNSYLHQTNNTTAYALITGATDGIGLGFAYELLAEGFNVLLHGRNPTKLQAVKTQLQSAYPTQQIHTLVADAASFTQSDITNLTSNIQSIPNMNLAILINNVGGTGTLKANFQPFTSHTPEEITATISLNILFTIHLTHALLPLLKAHNTRSLIMNISSQAHVGVPYLPVYSGTKAFIHAFSHSLATEFASFADDEPIEVLEILVGSVQTQQNRIPKPTFFVPDARTMARSALRRVGCGERNGVPAYWPHGLQQALFGLMPGWVLDRVMVGALKGLAGQEERVW